MLLLVPALLLLAVNAPRDVCDAQTLAERIDQRIEARLSQEGIRPAPLADDAEFFRRLSLDLNGRIPSLTQLIDFLDDRRPNKRRLWIDELLDGRDNAPLYVDHFTNVWRRRVLAHTQPQPPSVIRPLEAWLRRQLQAGAAYDDIARGLLTDEGAIGFRKANDDQPEKLTAATARLLLGLKLECAQCHDHPFAHWKRKQFWQYAAFFSTPREGPPRLRIGDGGAFVEASFLDGGAPNWKGRTTPRAALAEWIARADNPWFARAAVNRVWQDLLGVGLVNPVDGLGMEDNPASHPELLDELAWQFAAHKFDTKYLLRAVVGSRTYQRSSRTAVPGRSEDVRLFARAAVRALSGEQLRDSVLVATGNLPLDGAPTGTSPSGSTLQGEFVSLFDDAQASPIESSASFQQALAMMNSRFISEVTKPANSPTLAAAISGSARPAARQIEDLYLVVLSRRPRPDESVRLVKYVEGRATSTALADVLWALLNSTEFVVNH
jgi:hypothetical protein